MKTRKLLVAIVILVTAIFFNTEAVNATYEEHTIIKLADSSILDKTIEDGDNFMEKANSGMQVITQDDTKSVTDSIYGVLMLFGMAAAVIVGLIIGTKYMMSTVDEKAAAKTQLVVYFIGCAVLFGALTIWRAVVGLLNSAL